MIFFTGLTFWVALKNPVTDCGCFGDALVISNWETFYKNIVLLALSIIIFLYRRNMEGIPKPKTAKIGAFASVFIYLVLVWYSYNHLPILNFRPYKNGVNIPEAMSIPKNAPQPIYKNILYYKNLKTNEIKEFTDQNAPWADTLNWVYSDMKTILVQEGYKPKIHDFIIENREGFDEKEQFLNEENFVFLIISHDLHKTNMKHQAEINRLADWALKNDMKFIFLTGNTHTDASAFAEKHGLKYGMYYCDATTLKTIMRSNPGLMVIKKGTIIDQWHHNDIPSPEKFQKEYLK
jgi:hypothetical protein